MFDINNIPDKQMRTQIVKFVNAARKDFEKKQLSGEIDINETFKEVWPDNVRISFSVPTEVAEMFFTKFFLKRMRRKSDGHFITKGDILTHIMWLYGSDFSNPVNFSKDIFDQTVGSFYKRDVLVNGKRGRPKKRPSGPEGHEGLVGDH